MAERDLCGRTLGEFVLRELLGSGGFGDVYRATQPRLNRDVVVKVLREPEGRNEVARWRFQREAQLASRLDHHYAAHVHASGIEHDGLLWIAMELVQGVTLDQRLSARGPMPLAQFVPFFEKIAEVVHCAHTCEIVHRDLKPSNVIVLEREGQLIPKLVDFGIAKASHDLAPPRPERHAATPDADGPVTRDDPDAWRLTRSRDRLGSSPYMSPEQWDNAATVGSASDVYALGVLAYKALTGATPFVAASQHEYRQLHLHAKVPSLGADFPSQLDRVLQRALAKTPEARHGTALELAADLRAALRASEHEVLHSAAQQWDDKARTPGLLWSGSALADARRWMLRAPAGALSDLDWSFVAASQRHARRSAWVRRFAGALTVMLVFGVFQYRAAMRTELAEEKTRSAQRLAEVTITQAELERGRSALLHGEPDAQTHLAEAYKRGDRSPSTAFMLARALQPRLAEQARFASSFGRMWSAAFSPDGRQIVTTDDRCAQVWDAQTYRLLFQLPHGGEVYQAVYSADGTRLATVSQDALRIWRATTGVLVRELRQRRSDAKPTDYYMGAISFDGELVAAIDSAGSVVHVWNAITGAPLAELKTDADEVPWLAFSSDGKWLATTGGSDVRVFETRTWKPVLTIRGPRIRQLAFDPTGPRLVTATATGDATIWAIPSGARIRHLREIGEPIDAVAFSPDGQLVVTASRDGTEQVWHAESGALQSQFNFRHSKVRAVEFDRASKLVLFAGYDGSILVADAALGTQINVLEGSQSVVLAAHFDPRSRRVIGASLDGTARVWDATAPYRRWSSPPVSDDCGVIISAEPDRRFIAVGCRDKATRVWDTARDELVAELPAVSPVDGDFASAFPAVSGAGDRAAIARGNIVEVYELPSGRLLRTVAHGAPVNVVAFAGSGRDIVSGAVDGSLLVTRDNGALLALPASSGGIDAAEILADGRVVAADAQRRLRVYDRDGGALADLEIPTRVMSLRIDGTRLITIPLYSGAAAPPLLVDLERYRVIVELEGHVGHVNSARWVAGGRIITAGTDGTARLWDRATGKLRQVYRGGSRFLADATLSPDGSLVIAGDADGLLRFWDPTSGMPLWTLQAHKTHLVGLHFEDGEIVTRGFSGELSRWKLPDAEQVLQACSGHERCVIVPR